MLKYSILVLEQDGWMFTIKKTIKYGSEKWQESLSLLSLSLNTDCGSFLNPLNDTFSIPSRYLFFSGYFDSAIRGATFLPTFSHFASHISGPFDFISWCNLLVEFYSNKRTVDVIFRQVQSQSSRYLICIILCQTHFLQVSLVRNIMSHTLKGLGSYYIYYKCYKIFFQKKISEEYVFATLWPILENIYSGKLNQGRNIVKTKLNNV